MSIMISLNICVLALIAISGLIWIANGASTTRVTVSPLETNHDMPSFSDIEIDGGR